MSKDPLTQVRIESIGGVTFFADYRPKQGRWRIARWKLRFADTTNPNRVVESPNWNRVNSTRKKRLGILPLEPDSDWIERYRNPHPEE